MRQLAAACLLSAAFFPAASRAETFHTCNGFIASIPTVISTQGVWCLRQDVATDIATGAAIQIEANNVTLDCNGFKVGGMAAGRSTSASGIRATNRANVTIRNCNVRGFYAGINLGGQNQWGHLIADNRVEYASYAGIIAGGTGTEITRNRMVDIGGRENTNASYGIDSWYSDVTDNVLDGLYAGTGFPDGFMIGINASGGVVSGNRLRNFVPQGDGLIRAIAVSSTTRRTRVIGNQLFGPDTVNSEGIQCTSAMGSLTGNFIADFGTSYTTCTADGTGNVVK